VWGIVLFYVLGSTWAVMAWVRLYLGKSPVPGEQEAMLRSQPPVALAIAFIGTALYLAAAIQLWRLRKRAFDLCVAASAVSVVYTIWQVIRAGVIAKLLMQDSVTPVIYLFFVAVAWAILGSICIYVWGLRERGVLE
jgi:hypothetical protein